MKDRMITMIKRREIKMENVFDMTEINKHFTPQEIANLRLLIETTDGRCVGCGTFDILNKKHYCKKCLKFLRLSWK